MASSNNPVDRFPVHATILAYGINRTGVLGDVLGLLRYGCGDRMSRAGSVRSPQPFDIWSAWVRSVGSLGVVLIRFRTNEESFRKLLRHLDDAKEVRGSIRSTNAPKQRPSFTEAGHVPSNLVVRVHRADRPYQIDQDIKSVVILMEESEQRWRGAGKVDGEMSGEDVFLTLLRFLGTDQKIDVAQADIVLTTDGRSGLTTADQSRKDNASAVAVMRVFDLAQRGESFLQNTLRRANEALPKVRICDAGRQSRVGVATSSVKISYLTDRAREFNGDKGRRDEIESQRKHMYIENALKGPRVLDKPAAYAQVNRLSILIHTLDVPGLFAHALEGLRAMGMMVEQACCRGLGRDAVMLFDVVCEDPHLRKRNMLKLLALETEQKIRQRLSMFFSRNFGRTATAERERGVSHSAGYWNVIVDPQVGKSVRSRGSSQTVECSVESFNDYEGLLQDIVDRIGEPSRGGALERRLSARPETRGPSKAGRNSRRSASERRASIFYLDLRPQNLPSQNANRKNRETEVGLGIEVQDAAFGARQLIEEIVKKEWWKNTCRTLRKRAATKRRGQ